MFIPVSVRTGKESPPVSRDKMLELQRHPWTKGAYKFIDDTPAKAPKAKKSNKSAKG